MLVPKKRFYMDFENYKDAFIAKAKEKCKSQEYIDRCLAYAKKICDNGCPVIYDAKHLSLLLGLKKSYVMRAITYTHKYYWMYKIPKKDGGVREIMEPLPNLKEAQLWILHNILYKLKVHSFAKAYVPGKKLKENGKFHTKKKIVVAIDVKDFFPSITKHKIKEIFLSLGYSDKLSDMLAKLCCLDGCLPQGAPTSPYLSNLFLRDSDDKIMKYCSDNKIIYTRYADDLTFSGDDFNVDNLVAFVEDTFKDIGLHLNSRKTRVMHDSDSQIVTGMVVNQRARLPKKERMQLRKEMYYVITRGIDDHLKYINCKKRGYVRNLMGRIMFALYLEPDNADFKDYRDYLMKLMFPDYKRNLKRIRLDSGRLVGEKRISELDLAYVEDFKSWLALNPNYKDIDVADSLSVCLAFCNFIISTYNGYQVHVVEGKMKDNHGIVSDCHLVKVIKDSQMAYYDVCLDLTSNKIEKAKSRYYFPLEILKMGNNQSWNQDVDSSEKLPF